ncbi:unnamed protein product [Lupinus luteus]|uniref:Uncharacterized protein n=1 Tax=Lupinus luteus TaxID=3873 RepID=A0AAV1WYX7_LUPLU
MNPKSFGIHRLRSFNSKLDNNLKESSKQPYPKVDSVERAAIKARCHYVSKKWLGGMLTNWYTTETRLPKLRDLITEQKTGKLARDPSLVLSVTLL